jgi:hypothetical protein
MKSDRVVYMIEELYKHWLNTSALPENMLQLLTDEQMRNWFMAEVGSVVKNYQQERKESE